MGPGIREQKLPPPPSSLRVSNSMSLKFYESQSLRVSKSSGLLNVSSGILLASSSLLVDSSKLSTVLIYAYMGVTTDVHLFFGQRE